MVLFKLTVLQTKVNERVTTILSIGSWIVKSGRIEVLKMSVAMKKRGWMAFSLIHPTMIGPGLNPIEIFGFKATNRPSSVLTK